MKKGWIVIPEVLVAGLLVLIMTVTGLLSGLDYMVRDKLYQIPRGIDGDIKIIAIDEHTLNEYGPIGTWSRERKLQDEDGDIKDRAKICRTRGIYRNEKGLDRHSGGAGRRTAGACHDCHRAAFGTGLYGS